MWKKRRIPGWLWGGITSRIFCLNGMVSFLYSWSVSHSLSPSFMTTLFLSSLYSRESYGKRKSFCLTVVTTIREKSIKRHVSRSFSLVNSLPCQALVSFLRIIISISGCYITQRGLKRRNKVLEGVSERHPRQKSGRRQERSRMKETTE